MYHAMAQKLTAICMERKWIEPENAAWCIYTIEKWMSILTQFLIFLFFGIIIDQVLLVVLFVGSCYMLRRRIGGWHADTPWQCQLLGGTLVVVTVILILAVATKIPLWGHVLVAFIADTICILQKPVYPSQLHFSEEVLALNNRKKTQWIGILALLQVVCLCLSERVYFAAINCGVIVSLVALFIEKCYKKKEGN